MGAPLPIVDSHNHVLTAGDLDVLAAAAARIPLAAFTVLALPADDASGGPNLPMALRAKRRFPGRAYAYGAWDHRGRPSAADRAQQVREQAAAGIDGWKILESKPDLRRALGEPLDGPAYADAFAVLESLDLPVVWHVADPATFWDPATTPDWARAQGWGYGPDYPAPETLLAEAERVLDRHPRLRVVFAHFLFLSEDLDAAGRFLEAHPRTGLDLAPGIELLYNLSLDRDRARDFFIRHASRIYFGTDAGGLPGDTEASVEARIRLVLRFLATADTFRVPAGADELLGPPAAGVIRGLDLPSEALERILSANQRERAGPRPRPLDVAAARRLGLPPD